MATTATVLAHASLARAQTGTSGYYFGTFAGSPPGYVGAGSTDARGEDAQFYDPSGVAVDAGGNVYVADYNNCTIRKITPAGAVTTLAGTPGLRGSADGTGAAARFDTPRGIAVDSAGWVYVADTFNNMIRKISPTGAVTTLAGMTGSTGSGSSDGVGTAARFNLPTGLAVDPAGVLFVADSQNHTIRRITPDGTVSTFAGLARTSGFDDGTGASARFSLPTGVARDTAGNLYVTEINAHRIRRVTADGVVTSVAGSTIAMSGADDGVGAEARFYEPAGIAVDSSGTLYVAERSNHTLRRIAPNGTVTTLAGKARFAGSSNGTGSVARFYRPWGVAVDATGNIYVGDPLNHMIRKVTPGGVVSTLAGTPSSFSDADGDGWRARFRNPFGISIDASGMLYVADWSNDTIRKITPTGVVTTLAGSSSAPGVADGTGEEARFYHPIGTAVAPSGVVYVADSANQLIRRISPTGVVSTLAGSASQVGSTDGQGTNARFFSPNGVAVDPDGNVIVADSLNHLIRKITPAGMVSTVAGETGPGGSADGESTAARFSRPYGVAVDSDGVIYVADTFNHTIRAIAPGGSVTTLAGSAGNTGTNDGVGTAARFNQPYAIAIGPDGNLFVVDRWNHLIRRVTKAGEVTTIGGAPGAPAARSGIGAAARFNWPQGIAVDRNGTLYIADSYNNTIRYGFFVENPPAITTHPVSQTVTSGEAVTLTVAASAPNGTIAYQWYHDGFPIAGAASAELTLPSAQSFHAGDYVVVAVNQGVVVASNAARLTIAPVAPTQGRLLNLSTRAQCLTGSGATIPGFVLSGSGTRRILIRGVGPRLALPPFGIADALVDPGLTLMGSGGPIAVNDNWATNANAAEIVSTSRTLGAFSLPTDGRDAALLVDLPAGSYTVPTVGVDGGTGIAIVELYDASDAGPDLINISTRGFVGSGEAVMIPGFVVSPEGARTVLIRAVGPGLRASFGLEGALEDPLLTVYRGAEPILVNDDWAEGSAVTAAAAAQVRAFALHSGSADAAFVVTLPPGTYTVHCAGRNGGTGIALAEVYLIP